jgi:hypothetical protein
VKPEQEARLRILYKEFDKEQLIKIIIDLKNKILEGK